MQKTTVLHDIFFKLTVFKSVAILMKNEAKMDWKQGVRIDKRKSMCIIDPKLRANRID